MKLLAAGITEVGGRGVNEDSFSIFNRSPWDCFVVADGLGGHGAGEVASLTAVQTIGSSFLQRPGYDEASLSGYIVNAQQEILRIQQSNSRYRNMRTTVVVLVTDGRRASWAHVGDSRLYMFRDQRILFHTLDQSVPQALVRIGEISFEQIRFHEDRNRLLQALGSSNPPKIEMGPGPVSLKTGDAFLLCTDGFWEWVAENEMEEDLQKAKSCGHWLELMTKRIITRAKPGNDNYSAVGVFVKEG